MTFYDVENDYAEIDLSELFSVTSTCSIIEPYVITMLDVDESWIGSSGTTIIAPSSGLNLFRQSYYDFMECHWRLYNF